MLNVFTRGVHANRRPVGTDQPDWNWPITTGLIAPTSRWRVSNLRTRLRRVEWQVSSLKTRATWPARQKLKGRRKSRRSGDDLALLNSDLATFGLPSLRLAQIQPRSSLFQTQICLISANPTQIYSNSAKNPTSPTPTRPNLGQILIDPKESRLTLIRSSQILDKNQWIGKLETDRFPLENWYDLTRLIWNFRRVGCGSKFFPLDNVGSSPSWTQTWPGSTRGHP